MADKQDTVNACESSPSVGVKNVFQRFLEVQKKVLHVLKKDDITIAGETYKAVSHDDVAAALHLPLAEAGIVLLVDQEECTFSSFELKNRYGDLKTWYRADVKVTATWINADNPEDRFKSGARAFAVDSSDKAASKAYSLALKIILLKQHLLESRDQEESRDFEKAQDDGPRGNQQQRGSGGKQQQQQSRPPANGAANRNQNGDRQGGGNPPVPQGSKPGGAGPDPKDQGNNPPAKADDGGKKQDAPAAGEQPGGPEKSKLSDNKRKRLHKIKADIGWTDGDLKGVINTVYGLTSTNDLDDSSYQDLTTQMELRLPAAQVIDRLLAKASAK